MKVLITGGSGFLGGAFVEFLEKKRVEYVLYDRAHPERIPSDIEAVVHFAGLTPYSGVNGGTVKDGSYHAANVEATKKLLHALTLHTQLKRFVHIGSAAEYGVGRRAFAETATLKPVNAYGISKVAQGALIKEFAKKQRVKTFHLRVFNIVGLPKKDKSVGRPTLFETLHTQSSPQSKGEIVVTNANDERDFVALNDTLEAVFAALVSKKGGRYEVLNIASGRATSQGDIIKLFGQLVNKDYSIKNLARTSTRSIANPAKAKKLLGWSPKTSLEDSVRALVGTKKRVVVVGAGVAGKMLLNEIKKEGRTDIIAIGFVDDDRKKQGTVVGGLRVLGVIDDLPTIIKDTMIDQVLVSAPSVGKDIVTRVMRLLPPQVSIKVLPSVSSIILGKVDLSYVRDIDPSDLIGRPLVKANQQLISDQARGKTFLVVGGAGSIGSEIVRQLYDSHAKSVVVLDSWEEGIYNLLEELHEKKNDSRPALHACIGTIRDRERIEEVLMKYKVEVLVHAAAYKHVPLMEDNPTEAHKTNVEGTKNLLDLAERHGVKDFLLISTDKAVNPTSVMGETKRKAELLVQAYATRNPGRRFCAVRFGNVLNSSGSILPKFLKQIHARAPVTVTHKDMTRYFMSIPEAVSLVLLSWVIAKNGQILLLDMGEPVKILDFALNLVRIHGLEPYTEIPIRITGMRPGEKIHEELTYNAHTMRKSSLPRIYIAEELPRTQVPTRHVKAKTVKTKA